MPAHVALRDKDAGGRQILAESFVGGGKNDLRSRAAANCQDCKLRHRSKLARNPAFNQETTRFGNQKILRISLVCQQSSLPLGRKNLIVCNLQF